ncbi:MAG: FtsW/RodA/SpoVE family cell cycle protein [Muribaculum sp.]|nr:FtsW/RodA/SpoVE family cell cycle protein [Muribaculum sp.]
MSEELIIHQTVDGRESGGTPRKEPRRRGPAPSGTISESERSARAEKTIRNNARHDPYIWGIYIMILLVSVIELFSASSAEVRSSNVYYPLIRHVMYLGGGLALVLWLQNLHFGYLSRFSTFFFALALGLLLFSTFAGKTINGAQRALVLFGFTIQPAEIMKLAVVIMLATILGRSQGKNGVSNKGVVLVATIVGICAALLWVNGLTNMVILMAVSLTMFLVGGIQLKKFCMVLVVYGVFVGVAYTFKSNSEASSEFDKVAVAKSHETQPEEKTIGRASTHKSRLAYYKKGVHPGDTINDVNRQVFYAKMAQANGGLFGRGPGNSRESARLPLAFSDYIYSIIVEDTGFMGGVFLLMLYLCLLARAGVMAYKCSRALPAFLIIGCAVLIVSQALVHMAIVTGVAPVSGQPLPLISKGGTSVLVMSAAIGIMLSVSRFAVTSKNKKEMEAESVLLPKDMQATNVSLEERK